MSSMNNWLGFSSLSPQELNSQATHHESQNSVFDSDGDHHQGDCFDLSSHGNSAMNLPSLNLPPTPFSFLHGFNRNTSQSQDWNMKEMSMNTYSCNSQNLQENQETPKLENFLGHSFNTNDHHQSNIPTHYHQITNNGHENTTSYNIYQESDTTNTNNSNIGLSMIKNWLRNNPAPPHVVENKVDDEVAQPQAQTQSLSLSMSTGSQTSAAMNGNAVESCTSDGSKVQQANVAAESTTQAAGGAIESVPRKSIDTFGQRTSIYRGVTRHRWTGRYEAHLWDNSCRREGQTRKGRQVYLGGYDKEDKAARSYDLAALKYWGTTTTTNFPTSTYEKEIEEMKHMTRQEYVASLRRKSSGFSRGASIYRGVTRHHQHGRWQARIGRVAGNKDLYLGTFSTQEEAAEAYDIAAIKFRGLNAVTNFEINRYDVKSIMESATLPIGGAAKRLKDAENAEMALEMHRATEANLASYGSGGTLSWPAIAFQQQAHHQPLSMYPYNHPRLWCKQEQQDQDASSHSFGNDIHHQLQLGNAQNLLQTSILHNLMGMDSSNVGSDSNMYGANGNFGMPMLTQDHNGGDQNGFVTEQEKSLGYDQGMYDQQARNLFYESQQSTSSGSLTKGGGLYDQGSAWIPTAVPTIAGRANNMATFTVWNDA